jgi:hypothetical protein
LTQGVVEIADGFGDFAQAGIGKFEDRPNGHQAHYRAAWADGRDQTKRGVTPAQSKIDNNDE